MLREGASDDAGRRARDAWRVRGATWLCGAAALALVAGCGGGGSSSSTTTSSSSQAQRAAAVSLQQAMDTSSRAIDGVRGTRASLERLTASLQPMVAQTSDVIGVLTPLAAEAGIDSTLLNAARQQRSFLQFAADSASARTRRAAESAIERARGAGLRASNAYSSVARQSTALAGILPASTTFNTGRLRDAVRRATKPKPKTPPKTNGGGSTGNGANNAGGSSSCGDGLSVNSVTSCPFARNVRDEYQRTGGASVIDVYSPVTSQTYTLTCAAGIPTVCRGGNGAVIYIR